MNIECHLKMCLLCGIEVFLLKNGKITKEYTQANIIAKQYGPFIKTNSPNNCHTPLLNSMIYRNSFKYP